MDAAGILERAAKDKPLLIPVLRIRWKIQISTRILASVNATSVLAAHIEEDSRARQAELQLPLDHGNLILARLPDVTARRRTTQKDRAVGSWQVADKGHRSVHSTTTFTVH
eukprot:6198559-Pleurochrysis_carterae.AAC.2